MKNNEMIVFYLLEGCLYSQMILNILKNSYYYYNIINVNPNDKGNYKIKNKMNTFPQIFYIYNDIKYKLGGYQEFNKLNMYFYNKKTYQNDIQNLKKNLNLDHKILLRLLIFLNK